MKGSTMTRLEMPAWACVSAKRMAHIERVTALLDQWARWTAWLDIYVKNANKPKDPKVASE